MRNKYQDREEIQAVERKILSQLNEGELQDMEGKILLMRGRTTDGNSWTNGGE
jgi:hypothetical protein